jgi:ABC-type transport system involved in multi-copper enzyme maturation permease subunit
MKNIILIIRYTIRELFAKKIIISFFGLSVLAVLIFGLVMNSSATMDLSISTQNQSYSSGTGQQDVDQVLTFMQAGMMWSVFILGLFISMFATAGLIPDLVRKGNIDLFLSKPISKFQLLTGKYLGAVFIVAANITFLIFSFWIIMGLRFSYWNPAFLFSIISILIVFLAYYSIITLLGLLTKNSVLPLAVTFICAIVISPFLSAFVANSGGIAELAASAVFSGVVNVLYYIIPQSSDIIQGTGKLLIEPQAGLTYMPLVFTGIMAVGYYALSVYTFYKKDY